MVINVNRVLKLDNGKLQITRKHYDDFLKRYWDGKFGTGRLGEKFYEHFKLSTLQTDQKERLSNLWAKDGESAKAFIEATFDITP